MESVADGPSGWLADAVGVSFGTVTIGKAAEPFGEGDASFAGKQPTRSAATATVAVTSAGIRPPDSR